MILSKKVIYQLTVLASLVCSVGFAQRVEMAPVSETYAIKNAVIVQAPGRVISAGTILVKDGLIKQVGTSVNIPSDAKVIEADSMYVYAGFIDGLSQAGIPTPERTQRPNDVKSMDPPYEWAGIAPQTSAASLLDAEDSGLKSLREAGFTISQIVPKGQMIPGKGAIVLLSGDKTEMVYQENSTLYSQLAGAQGVFPATVIGVMAKYRDLYRNATYGRQHVNNYASNPAGMERPQYDPVLTAMFPVTAGQLEVTFQAEDDLDIQRILTLKKDLGFNLTLAGVERGWPALDRIKSSGSSVMLSFDLPKKPEIDSANEMSTWQDKEIASLEKKRMESYLKYASQAANFHKAGIRYGFSSIGAKPGDLKKNLMAMIENGLPEDAALAALTTNPASLLGISSVAGTVDVGKMANLVVTTAPYFTEDSAIKYVLVDGTLYEFDVKAKGAPVEGEGAAILAGTWSYTASDGDGESTGTITFVNENGEFSGTMTNTQVPVEGEITDVSMSGSDVTFVVTFTMDGQGIDVEATVSISGNKMEGDLITPFGNASIEGEKDPNN